MRILVTGANGQLGRAIVKQGENHELVLTDYDTLDITDGKAVASACQEIRPDAVIHCAAYTNVDRAETDTEGAFKVNVKGTMNLAAGCLSTGARMVYISTDYVFDGKTSMPYRESDTVNPKCVYGLTKWQGEQMVRTLLARHIILRTAWLYGEGHNFVRTMLRMAGQEKPLRVVNDQIGTPTSTTDLSKAIFRLLDSDISGTYHASCQGECSWYDFAREIFRQTGQSVDIQPVTTAEYPCPARRPAYSVLDNHMLRTTVGDPMRNWQDALREYLTEDSH